MTATTRRRAKRPAAVPIRPGRLVGIAREGEEWRAVYCRMPALDPKEPYLFDLRQIEELKNGAKAKVSGWVAQADGAKHLPAELAVLQERYAARAISKAGAAGRDARTILKLLAQLAGAKQASDHG